MQNNEYKLNLKYRRYFQGFASIVLLLYWVYMNRSRCHEDIHRPLGIGFDKTSSKFPFRIFGQRMESVSSGVTVGVQYLGEGGVLD